MSYGIWNVHNIMVGVPLIFRSPSTFMERIWWRGGSCEFYPEHPDNPITGEDMLLWLNDNLSKRCKISPVRSVVYVNNLGSLWVTYTIRFRSKEDVMAFKLRWL
jgi:hypothetical protein